ncbi:MAG: thioredoxin-disulfide reductase [Microscillaceae bacterium]|jgi:thioredoxin reductase (NADPH)|nr:thioredoxin-disulfide reductase [Microscillaceae bacterium]
MANIEKIHCLIIGSGPAGYTAAIYAARAGLKPVLYQGNEPGGQLMLTTDVENFPGYPAGIGGPQMMADFQAQAERLGAEIRSGFATAVDFAGGKRLVEINGGEKMIEADAIIISTGASAKWLGMESEMRLRDCGGGVSSCAVCDGFFHRGKDVMVVGGGDTAAEDASYLSNICRKVYLVVRRDEMRASYMMQQRVKSKANIEILWNTVPEEVLGNETVTGVRVKNLITQETQDLPISGFFVAIGHTPNTHIFKEYLEMDETGYLITQKGSTHTNLAGVFACGDVQDKTYRQAITAAGTGCMAALDAERYLATKAVLAAH